MRRIPPAALGLAATFLCGCVAYRPQPLSPERTLSAYTSRTLSGPDARAAVEARSGHRGSWPPASWDLEKLTAVAWRLHPDLAVARAQLEGANAAIRTAGERPNPTVSVAPQLASPLHAMTNTYGIDFDLPIETAGKRGSRSLQARERSAAAGFHVADTAWQVRSRLRKGLLELFAATQRRALLEREVASQSEVITGFEQRIALGEAARPESVQSRLLLNQLRLLLADAERAKGVAQVNVAEAVGVSSRAIEGAPFSFAAFDHVPAAKGFPAARRAALRQRADILGSLADYAAAEAALRLEIAKQYPDIHLNPGYQWDAGVDKWTIGFSLTLPILNQNRGAIAEAEAHRREAAANFLALQARVLAELDRALAGFRGALAKLATAQTLLAVQEKQSQSAAALLAAGESDRLALTSAQLERDAAALSRLDALLETQTALGALEDAAQTSFSK